jgi:hypothetical protein
MSWSAIQAAAGCSRATIAKVSHRIRPEDMPPMTT